MTKAQLHAKVLEEVQALLETTKVTKAFTQELINIIDTNLKPKAGGGSMQNPPKEIDGVMNYYCRFHERYEPEHDMVISQGKSKGYCKASISLWNKTQSSIKRLESSVVDAIANGDIEDAQAKAVEVKALKDVLNVPSHYDYDRDWDSFGRD
jgi:hypothetical protein